MKQSNKAQAFDLLRNGQVSEARILLVKLCRKKPVDPEALMALGTAEGMLGNVQAAEANLKKSIALNQNQPGAHYSLGRAQQAQGKLTEARKSLSTACRLQPAVATFHSSLGNVQNELGHTTEALFHMSKAAEIDPESKNHHFNLGNTLNRLGRREQAIAAYQRALSIQPDFTDALVSTGNTLMYLDKLDEATSVFDRALELQPGKPGALAGKAAVLNKRGKYTAAASLLEPLLTDKVVDAGVAETFTSISHHVNREHAAFTLIERLLKNTGISKADRARLCFAHAFLHDRNSNYDEAFRCYEEANKLREMDFSIAAHRDHIDHTISTYSAGFMSQSARAHNTSQLPVFIVGMPRSGTSLVEQILASHPDVYGAGELGMLGAIAVSIEGQTGEAGRPLQAIHQLTPENAEKYAGDYINHLREHDPRAARITDKMPANFMLLGLIYLLFSGARIIHCKRNPVDTCLSCYFQDFSGNMPFSNNLTSLGNYYREYERLMGHWKSVLEVPMLEVRYEDLVSNAELVIPGLVEFCGLDWNDACMEFHKSERTVATASYDQVRQPLYTSSIERWRHYENHLGELLAALDPDTVG